MFIEKIHISKFRALENVEFDLGKKLTLIAGYNGSMKTTLLGILSQTFTIPSKGHEMSNERTIDGNSFRSQFSEKFKFNQNEKPKEHLWKLFVNESIFGRSEFEVESIPRDSSGAIRFWSTEGKEQGSGYLQFPVYYLSLKRVSPIGEEKGLNAVEDLSAEEKDFLAHEQKEILVAIDGNYTASAAKSTNKFVSSAHADYHDINTISAGQDSLGRILLSVLSFKRLMNRHENYQGGIILIDEIESTLHPIAQRKLMKRLMKYATDYKLQFICTTHSPAVVKGSLFDRHNTEEVKLVYLKKISNRVVQIKNSNPASITSIIDELEGNVSSEPVFGLVLKLYCEDVVAFPFIRALLKHKKVKIKYMMGVSLGAENYDNLIKHKVPEFCGSIIVLDADKQKVCKKHKNMICLPGMNCPEKEFYMFLYALREDDSFWDNALGGYSKEKCFQTYPCLLDFNSKSEEFKKWFEEQKSHWGKANEKLNKYWISKNPEKVDAFDNDFVHAYNFLAKNKEIPEIS